MTVATLFANGFGDALLTLPTLRALTTLFPDQITLVCPRGYRQHFFADLQLQACVETSFRINGFGRDFNASHVAAAVGTCRIFLSLVPWYSRSLMDLVSALAPVRSVGFSSDFDVALPLDHRRHSMDLAFEVPKYFDPSLCVEDYACAPAMPPRSRRKAQLLRGLLPPTMRMLAVHADTDPEKMWPTERFVKVLDGFLEKNPDFFVFVVGHSRQALDTGHQRERVILCYGIPLALSFCLIREADLFLGVDSCMLHAADFFRIPGVGLFGSTEPREFGFRLTRHRHIRGRRSMLDISTNAVIDGLQRMRERYVPRSA
jgi:hypothetical protein